jgi:type II secretory pathway component PulC
MRKNRTSKKTARKIPPRNILRKMGLRSRDVVTGVNDQEITSPDQDAEVFEKLAAGGEVTITIERRRRTRKISLNIE